MHLSCLYATVRRNSLTSLFLAFSFCYAFLLLSYTSYFNSTNPDLVHSVSHDLPLFAPYPGPPVTSRKKTAVVLFSFTRTKYLVKTALSLAANDLSSVDVIVMQDVPPPPLGFFGMFSFAAGTLSGQGGGEGGEEGGRVRTSPLYKTAKVENPGYLRQILPAAEIFVAKFNVGIAIAYQEAMKKVFVQGDYDSVIFLEDDAVISKDFVSNMLSMIEYTEKYPAMSSAFAGYKNFHFEKAPTLMSELPKSSSPAYSKDTLQMKSSRGRDASQPPPCDFVVHPLKYNVGRNVGGSNWWAWTLTRSKWKRMWQCQLDSYEATGLDTVFYTSRDSGAIKDWLGSMGCPTEHASQDHMRSCCFRVAKMTEKLRPVERNSMPIGKEGGLHETVENFKKKGLDDKTMDYEHGIYESPIQESSVCYVQN